MTTDTMTEVAEAALNQAEAIVEAEWMRLQQHDNPRGLELAESCAEMPAARSDPPRVGTLTTTQRPPTEYWGDGNGWSGRWWPAPPVWATQRSPPPGRGSLPEVFVDQRR